MKSSKYISDTSKDFALYTAEVRAIPKVTDGLKDGQRKAIWCLRNKAEQIKTIAAASLPIFEMLYVHGDSSMADTVSGLAAPYINNICYLEGIGQFGSKLSPNVFGAPRYTSIRRSSATVDLLLPDLDIVPMMDNYDGSNQSAKTFLPLVPTVLLNGISGVATGWSTEILPHKLSDIIDGCLDTLNKKKIKDLQPFWSSYDITVTNIEGSSWQLQGKLKIIDASTVEILELPPGIKLEKFREELDKLEEEGKIRGYTDKSKKTVQIEIKLKREFLREASEEDLINFFKLRTRTTERLVVIGFNDKIKVYETHNDLFKDFVEWRLTWYKKRYEVLLDQTAKDLLFQLALKECFDEEFPDKLRIFETKADVVNWILAITDMFQLDQEQISKIASFPSYRWAKDSYQDILEEIKRLENLIESYKLILSSEENIKDEYRKELKVLKKKYAN